MTAVALPAVGRASDLRRLWWRHPEVPAAVAVVAAWVYLAIDHWVDHDQITSWRFEPTPWAAMVVAMMVPAALPMVRLVSFDSLWDRRHRAPALFLATYVAGWTLAGTAAALVVASGERITGMTFDPGTATVVGALVVAAAWQFTDRKRRYLRRCHRRTPLAPRGWKADAAVIAYGAFHVRACLGSCGVAMAAMFVSVHDFHLMVPLTALLTAERLAERPRPRLVGVGFVAVAAFTVLAEGVA
ncbi:MAG: DUF2182 domain-containing protein [Acidimicrobiales bacterium]